jgi:hypothetical protein
LQTGQKSSNLDAHFQKNKNFTFFFRKVCQNKKRLYLCSPFRFKKLRRGIQKFFEKIEASLAEANSSVRIKTPNMVKLQVQEIK